MFEQIMNRDTKKSDSSSSSNEANDSDQSSEEIRALRRRDEGELPLRGKKWWMGRPKLVCPIFYGVDPISWLSRVNQYFNLNEIRREDKVKYAAYYLEGEANVWWQ